LRTLTDRLTFTSATPHRWVMSPIGCPRPQAGLYSGCACTGRAQPFWMVLSSQITDQERAQMVRVN
jgi:hypothetical protein